MCWKYNIITVCIMISIVGAAALTLHLTAIGDPNEKMAIAVVIRDTLGIWWVALVMGIFAFFHATAVCLAMEMQSRRKRALELPAKR